MENCIVIIDSGMGGLSVLMELNKKIQNVNFVYFADTKNLPYGNKTKSVLLDITVKNLNYIFNKFKPKALIFGCNTIGTTILKDIKRIFKKENIFAIKPDLFTNESIQREPTLVLATNKTIDSLSTKKLNANIILCKMPTLANKVEKYYPNTTNIVPYIKRKLNQYKSKNISNIFLGCTHYNFVAKEITTIFNQVCVYNGIEQLIKSLEKSLPKLFNLNVKNKENKINLIITKNCYKTFIRYKKIIGNCTLIK